jgi:hypothetical protein
LSQQITLSKLKKGFLVIGIVLLISSFFFFYLASVFNIDHVTTYQDAINFNSGGVGQKFFLYIGTDYTYPVNPQTVTMQPDDYLTVSFHNVYAWNGTIYIVLVRPPLGVYVNDVVAYSPYGALDFTNKADFEITIQVYLVSQNTNNTISITTTLNHYERPQWVFFGIGVGLSSLGVIPIFKSKK